MKVPIPLARPEITDADRDAVLSVLRTSHLSMGPKLREFEQALCDYTGSKHAVAVNSGTSALQIAVRALGLARGDEVILPSFTFSALLNVILQEGLQPRFVDIEGEGYNMNPDLVAAAITPRTRLILAVHTFGFPLNFERLQEIAVGYSPRARRPRHTIHIIEDACEALGAEVSGHKAGTLGEAGLFAFYPNKQITTGEGGALVTSNEELAAHAARLRNQGRDPALDWHQQAEIGFSYRLSDINCALGISQLGRIEAVIAKRQKLAEAYSRELKHIAEVICPPLASNAGRISWFVYVIQLSEKLNSNHRDWICESLMRKGIAAGRYFAPLHLQPVLRNQGVNYQSLRRTEFVADRVIALPFFNELTEEEIQQVCAALDESMRVLRRKV